MEHGQVQELFSDYWDKALAPPQREEVAAHLASCPACQEEYARFSQAMAPLAKLGKSPLQPPPDLVHNVPALINRRSRGRFFSRRAQARRLALQWLPVVMLGFVAVLYLVFKVGNPLLRAR